MGTDGAYGLLFCAAKRSGAFPPNTPAGLRARFSRLGGFHEAVLRVIVSLQLGPGSLSSRAKRLPAVLAHFQS